MDRDIIEKAKEKAKEIEPHVWERQAKVLSEIDDQIAKSLAKLGSVMEYAKGILSRQELEIILNPKLDKQAIIKKLAEIGDKAEAIRKSAAEIVFSAQGQRLEVGDTVHP